MSRDIAIYKTPSLDLSLEELIVRLQDKFGKEGTLNGLVRSTIGREVENELNTNRQVFREILLQNWDAFFPGVSVCDVDVDAELDGFIAERRPELTAILHNYVMRRAVVAGTTSLNLLLSADVVQRTSDFPCNGKPHKFAYYPYQTSYESFVVSEQGETYYSGGKEGIIFDLVRAWSPTHHPRACGKLRRKVKVLVFKCENCATVRLGDAWFTCYCESCGYADNVKKIRRPHASKYVQQILLLNGLGLYHY